MQERYMRRPRQCGFRSRGVIRSARMSSSNLFGSHPPVEGRQPLDGLA